MGFSALKESDVIIHKAIDFVSRDWFILKWINNIFWLIHNEYIYIGV